ncbi:hypothetical protein BDY17DRAFT_313604 [Neohortaea acidophila]|uniref:Uncharacterized protein n=1 Tax=Neohortaea acidophila TaxID=245834 RepID=A0A6A6PG81_9PEZI|nr:uncharacterized protein BDY17DRAFT_313604 [Neohortaea acidophila]KAF2478998.1 hypothetical protein BDY17DRAFT_313604 [Neohortaea acidophila]
MRRRNPCSYLNRRLQIVASLTTFILFSILFLGTTSEDNPYLSKVPYGPQIRQGTTKVVGRLPSIPKELPHVHVNTAQWLNRLDPFQAPAHSPPPADQPDSREGDISWHTDWHWMNPFSTVVTQDERAVLPPLKPRPPVYTYFDAGGRSRDERSRKAEQEVLEIWRRAWWAQGFKPVVLSRSEAMNHPKYKYIKDLKLEADMELELLRWLAWASMGTGILCNWLAVPMAHYEEPLLHFLRAGEYSQMTRYDGLEGGLYVGTKEQVEQVLEMALRSTLITTAQFMYQLTPEDTFHIEPNHDGVAFYSSKTIKTLYKSIDSQLTFADTRGDGLTMLPALINSHLHLTWQNSFPKGIAVLKPLAQNTTYMIDPAIDIARNLSTCTASPITTSCPPNRPNCSPCVSRTPMIITTPPIYRNDSAQFLIGTVPHPYTLQSLIHNKEDLDVRFIRRKTSRDSWVMAATRELLGAGISSFSRLASLKDAVASEHGISRSLWLTAEEPVYLRTEKDLQELDWIFGFRIPRHPMKDGKSETPVPGPERRPPPPKQDFDGPKPDEKQLLQQMLLGEKAQDMIKKSERHGGQKSLILLRNAVEAWNMADTEVWKFVRAFNARRLVERQKWQKEEDAYLGKGLYDRWKETLSG